MDYEALLQQVMAGGGPSAEQKKAALAQALAASGFATLAARTGSGWGGAARALGQGGLLGMGAYNQALGGDPNAGLLDKLKAVESIKKMQASDEAQKSSAAFSQQLAGAFGQQPAAGPQAGPPGAQASPADRIAQYRRVADMYAQRGDSESAKRFDDIADRMQAEYSTTPQVVMRDGKPSLVQFGKRGEMRAVEGAEPTPDTQVVNLGGTQRVIDKRTTAPGTDLPVTMDPAQKAADEVARANLTLNKEKHALDRDKYNLDHDKTGRDGKALTESQASAAMYLGMMEAASKELDKIGVPGQIKRGLSAEGVPYIPGAVQRFVAGDNAQKYNQAALQWTEAMLRATTGATAPPDEVKRAAQMFFPQVGEGDAVIKQKAAQRKRMESIMAVRAGRSGANQAREAIDAVVNGGTKAGANSGWGISEVR